MRWPMRLCLQTFADDPAGWGVRKASIHENVAAHKFTPVNDFRSLTALLRNFATPKPTLGPRSEEP